MTYRSYVLSRLRFALSPRLDCAARDQPRAGRHDGLVRTLAAAPHTGWTDTVTSAKLATPIQTDGPIAEAVSVINWTACSPAAGIKPGQFDRFVIIAGKLPAAMSITFKAIQTYSDGSKVSWIEVAAPVSGVVPDHPAQAPVLTRGAASANTSVGVVTKSSSSSKTGPIELSVIVLVAAAGALGLGVVSRTKAKAGRS